MHNDIDKTIRDTISSIPSPDAEKMERTWNKIANRTEGRRWGWITSFSMVMGATLAGVFIVAVIHQTMFNQSDELTVSTEQHGENGMIYSDETPLSQAETEDYTELDLSPKASMPNAEEQEMFMDYEGSATPRAGTDSAHADWTLPRNSTPAFDLGYVFYHLLRGILAL